MPPLRALHVQRWPMGHGQARVRIYDAPPGPTTAPRLLLQGAMPAAFAELLTLLLQAGAFAKRLDVTIAGATRHADDARVR